MRRKKQNRRCLMLCLVLFLMAGCTEKETGEETLQEISVEEEMSGSQDTDTESPEAENAAEDDAGDGKKGKDVQDSQGDLCYVHVCGEVECPGVYELAAGSRIYEAVELAGGMKETAQSSALNLAEEIVDGQQIYVPSKEEGRSSAVAAAGQTAGQMDDGKVDLNTAGKEELMTLSGIGEVRAEAIIEYREEKGKFSSIEELKEIEGIKDGVFGKIKDKIKV